MDPEIPLLFQGQSFPISITALFNKCQAFKMNPVLLAKPYHVRSTVSPDHFQLFLAALTGDLPPITPENIADLHLLSSEFEFTPLATAIAAISSVDVPARQELELLKSEYLQHERSILDLHHDLSLLREEGPRFAAAIRSESEARNCEVSKLRQQLQALADDLSRSDRERIETIAELWQTVSVRFKEFDQERALLRQTVAEQQETVARQQRELEDLREQNSPKPSQEFAPNDRLDGIVAHLARVCGGNVHDQGVVAVTSSRPVDDKPKNAAKNAADVKSDSWFSSIRRKKSEEIPHTWNNWLCYDFKQRMVALTHYAIKSFSKGTVGGQNLRSWLVETSVNGVDWTTVDYQDTNSDLNGKNLTRLFAVKQTGECRLVRLVNIGRNHAGTDEMCVSAFELFGTVIENSTGTT
jgi:hypothetical protein